MDSCSIVSRKKDTRRQQNGEAKKIDSTSTSNSSHINVGKALPISLHRTSNVRCERNKNQQQNSAKFSPRF